MSIDTQSITDRKLFRNILKQFFFDKSCFINNPWGNAEVRFLSSEGEYVQLHSPGFDEDPKNCMVFTRNYNNIIFVYLKFCGKKTENIYLFNPTKFQIIETERKDERCYLEKDRNNRSTIFITNFISQTSIINSLNLHQKKIKRIEEIIGYDTSHEFEYIKVYFYNYGRDDPRMNYFCNNKIPIFIQDINFVNDQNTVIIENYMKYIYKTDSYLNNHKRLISEISVPVMFNSWIPYGYVQINNSTPLTTSSVEHAVCLASFIDDSIKRENIFSVSRDKLDISDISKNGIGIIFSNKKYIPYYLKDSFVLLDIFFPSSLKTSILADVRHLEIMQNKTIKAGFRIREMDDEGRYNFDSFLSSINT